MRVALGEEDKRKRTDRGYGHEHIFVEQFAAKDAAYRAQNDVCAHDKVGDEKEDKFYCQNELVRRVNLDGACNPSGNRQRFKYNKCCKRKNDAPKVDFLLVFECLVAGCERHGAPTRRCVSCLEKAWCGHGRQKVNR